MSEQMARQIQRASDEMEAKREAITRARARKPRRVRSRPTSPVMAEDSSNDIKHASSSSSEEELKVYDLEQPECENDITDQQTSKPVSKRMSIQLPIGTDLVKRLSENKNSKQPSQVKGLSCLKTSLVNEEMIRENTQEDFSEKHDDIEDEVAEDDETHEMEPQEHAEARKRTKVKGRIQRSRSHSEAEGHSRSKKGAKGDAKYPARRHTYANMKRK